MDRRTWTVGSGIWAQEVGEGPLVVFCHGFPESWYSWRHQMAALSQRFQVVAIDQRGYNLSDKPKGVENYDMELLVADDLWPLPKYRELLFQY